MKTAKMLLLVAFCISCYPGLSAAAETMLRSVGIRAGLSATATEHYFHQYEAAAVFQLPWEWRARSGWGMSTELDVAAGLLRGEKVSGFVGSAGPAFSFGKPGFPLEMDIGISPTYLSRDRFDGKDFHGSLQFASHFGLDLRLGPRVGLEYRFQHMSNAGMNGGANPGLNMHLLGLNWYFAR